MLYRSCQRQKSFFVLKFHFLCSQLPYLLLIEENDENNSFIRFLVFRLLERYSMNYAHISTSIIFTLFFIAISYSCARSPHITKIAEFLEELKRVKLFGMD